MKTQVKVSKWGNSLALRIPSAIAKELSLKDDSLVQITSDGKQATLAPEPTAAPSLDELVGNITHHNMHTETDWGEPVGGEVW